MKRFIPHPYANLLPMMSESELAALEADILATGRIVEPGVTLGGKLLDGRNRQEIALKHKLPFPTVEFNERKLGDPLAWVKSKMLHRHLSESQRACVAVEFGEEMGKRKSPNSDSGSASVTNDDLAKLFAVGRSYVFQARSVRERSPKLYREVFDGRMPVYVADRQVRRKEKGSKLRKMARAVRADASTSPSWQLIAGEAVAELNKLRDAGTKVQLVATDPRYNIGIDYGGGKAADLVSEADYLDWCQKWMDACADLLADDGSMFVMIDAPHLADFEIIMRRHLSVPMHRRNVIVWTETFAQYTPHNFTPSWRAILYYTKSPKRFTWHGDQILIPSDRLIKYDDSRANPDGKVPSNVWSDIPRMVDNDAERMPGFPTQIPQRLMERIVLAASNPGDTVLDPANGSGTTGRAAIRHDRRYIGIDINPDCIAWADASFRLLQAQLQEGK